ncbi:hypothetical protein BV898_09932 [Hypsibius exemplaris]|uniref:Receptor ligand binding region domain-containing protein n=1 Tax=Hypsibius exemplaris TaxID=2072580 RepID=A0A1W0WLB5_HYPEX|nr:hypothetical protein BV898_09932 [Hypsibius exemplaris]
MSGSLILQTAFVVVAVNLRLASGATVIQVRIASPAFALPSAGAGAMAFNEPVLEAASIECNRIYAGLFNFSYVAVTGDREAIHTNEEFTDQSPDLVAEWYYRLPVSPDIVPVIITPGNVDISMIHQITAQVNVLCIATMSYFKSQYNLQPAAPMIGTAFVPLPPVAEVFANLLVLYNWTTVYVITDLSAANVYQFMLSEIRKVQTRLAIRFIARTIDTRITPSFNILLREFTLLSRVLMFFGRAEQTRRLMIDAFNLNLTRGRHVFICDEPYPWPKNFGVVGWYLENSTDNEIARMAFRTLIFVHPNETVDLSSPRALHLAALFRRRTKDLYNITVTAFDQPTRELFSSYASVFMLAEVMNETLSAYGREKVRDGRWLAQQFWNRTFPAAGGLYDIYVDPTGLRRVTLQVSHFSGNDSHQEAFLVQSNLNITDLRTLRNISSSWPGGRWPPPNEPRCGYLNNLCHGAPGFAQNGGLTGVLTLSAVALVVGAAGFWARWHLHDHHLREPWWVLSVDLLLAPAKDVPTRVLSKMLLHNVLESQSAHHSSHTVSNLRP